MVSSRALFAFVTSCLLGAVVSHEPLTNGTSTGPNYSTWQTSLLIPNNKFSLSARRWSSAAGPVFWFKYQATKGDVLYVGVGSGVSVANQVLRASVYVFGPALPKKYRPALFKVSVPTGPKYGYLVYKSARVLADCKFLTTDSGKTGNSVVKYNGITRCGSYNNVTGTGFFPMIDGLFTAPASGSYYFAFHLDATWEAGWYVSTGSPFHSHDENHTLPVPPLGNARNIDTSLPNLTVSSFIGGVQPYLFSILK